MSRISGAVWAVGDAIAAAAVNSKTIVIKSTVPVGTNRQLAARLAARARVAHDVASNPEFLKEGAAVDDFMKPDRVVVGVRRAEVGDVLKEAVCTVSPHRTAVSGRCHRKAPR